MIRRSRVTIGLVAAFASAPLRDALAQCPDGSPPPCRSAVVAAAPRRVNPPLDDRTWIVVPFDNLRKNEDIDWLRGASVNLLYLDMSRWSDIRVIDDERVADLVRETPEARRGEQLDLSAGLAVARRAGAGRLVMGDLLALGNRTSVTAKVYDVRNGQRMRSVQEATAVQDSVIPMFSKLAQKILDVAPPVGANLGTVGTASVAAYQEYMEGIRALNAFSLAEARTHLERALQLDSTFALAHHKLGTVIGWGDPTNPSIRTHAEAAARLATALPARERNLIAGSVQMARREYGRSCDTFSALLRSDSSDVEAWYGLGDCRFHDNVAEPVGGDTTRIRFRGDLNESIRAFRRALELDPAYHLAYQHIVDGSLAEARAGRYCVESRCVTYLAMPIRSGDSLIFVPQAIPRDTSKLWEQRAEYLRTSSRRRNVAAALAIADQWVTASPQEDRAQIAYAAALLAAGRIQEAQNQVQQATLAGPSYSAFNTTLMRVEIAAKLWRPDAARIYDSARAPRTPPLTLGAGPQAITVGTIVSLAGPMFGRFAGYDSLILAGNARATPAMQRANRMFQRVLVGVMPDSGAQIERAAFDEALAKGGPSAATGSILATVAFGLRMPRATWPPLDTSARSALVQPAFALARGDTNRLRAVTRKLDSLSSVYLAALTPDTGITMIAADAYVVLKDSLAALRLTRRMLDSIVPYTPLVPLNFTFPYAAFVPRAMLLRADLAAALGHRDEARLWYRRFLDMWGGADPEFQPVVERARKSYLAVGGP